MEQLIKSQEGCISGTERMEIIYERPLVPNSLDWTRCKLLVEYIRFSLSSLEIAFVLLESSWFNARKTFIITSMQQPV